jgi:hypothetical protein
MEVDLCFVMDCTGSMSSHIEGAKDCIVKVADYMAKMEPAIKIRVGFCGYRDHCDNTSRLQIFDFTDSCMNFRNYITANVSATGGGDSPEDVLGGLDASIKKMTWRNTTRVLLHVCDFPPHGRRFNNLDDDYPNGDPHGLTAEGVLEDMQSANIHYFFGKITDQTEAMIRIFRGIIGEFPVFNLEIVRGDPEALVEKFFEAACNAITTAISLS